MTDQTYAALEQALRDHVLAEQGSAQMVTDWFLIAASIGEEDGVTGYTHARSWSSPHALAGLIARGQTELDAYEDDED